MQGDADDDGIAAFDDIQTGGSPKRSIRHRPQGLDAEDDDGADDEEDDEDPPPRQSDDESSEDEIDEFAKRGDSGYNKDSSPVDSDEDGDASVRSLPFCSLPSRDTEVQPAAKRSRVSGGARTVCRWQTHTFRLTTCAQTSKKPGMSHADAQRAVRPVNDPVAHAEQSAQVSTRLASVVRPFCLL
jgi:hypothetical protein